MQLPFEHVWDDKLVFLAVVVEIGSGGQAIDDRGGLLFLEVVSDDFTFRPTGDVDYAFAKLDGIAPAEQVFGHGAEFPVHVADDITGKEVGHREEGFFLGASDSDTVWPGHEIVAGRDGDFDLPVQGNFVNATSLGEVFFVLAAQGPEFTVAIRVEHTLGVAHLGDVYGLAVTGCGDIVEELDFRREVLGLGQYADFAFAVDFDNFGTVRGHQRPFDERNALRVVQAFGKCFHLVPVNDRDRTIARFVPADDGHVKFPAKSFADALGLLPDFQDFSAILGLDGCGQ